MGNSMTNTASQYQYNEEVTKNSELYKNFSAARISYSELCKNEGEDSAKASNIVVNLDKVAVLQKKNPLPSTMDFLIGINLTGKSSGKYLLGECLFRYKSPVNIIKSDLKDKIDGSKGLFSEDVTKIHNEYIFLFSKKCIAQARSHLARLQPNLTWKALTSEEFESVF